MLYPNFCDFLKLLEENGVKYLVVGGYAVGYHGYRRYTGDIDIFVAISDDNAEKLTKVYAQFGFPNTFEKSDFLKEDAYYPIGEDPQRIHLLTGIAGVTFDECYASRCFFENKGLRVSCIGLNALIKSKEALKRKQDNLDIKRLSSLRANVEKRGWHQRSITRSQG